MTHSEKLLFEISREGREGLRFEDPSFCENDAGLPDALVREDIKGFPELSEVDVVRHYTRLSKWNYGVDDGLYPLGSCTMKYNPKVNEDAARLEGFVQSHPCQDDEDVQGNLELLWNLERALSEISGMDTVTLQPSAGAHGELTGMLVIRRYLESQGDARKSVLIPDSAHGTNPASAALAGYEAVQIPSCEKGRIDLKVFKEKLTPSVAALMVTNPNTLGVFESDIAELAELLHQNGSLLYCDGANLNAYLGRHRPGDAGVDLLHMNLHKTFSTPHGGGGPGAGAVGVKKYLAPFLPGPRIEKRDGGFAWAEAPETSIGRMRSFYGNFGVLVRAYAYILSMGGEGLKQAAELAVLHNNYLRARLQKFYHLEYETSTLHESVFSDKRQAKYGVSTLDIAKRLLDFGFHPPTIYFPSIVHGALMVEPTETEPLEELDRFVSAMEQIAKEAEENPQILKDAPHTTPRRRLDELRAARHPKLRWTGE